MQSMTETINQYLKFCQHQKNLNRKTVKAYRIDLQQFMEFLNEQEIIYYQTQ